MSENKKIQTTEIATNTDTKYTLDYVLEQIEKLHADKDFYSTITNEFKSVMAVNSDSFAAAESAQAIGKAIMCRETTNQQLIAFYEKMYDDLKPKTLEPIDPVNEAIKRTVAEFISQKADYVADRSHKVNAEEFEAIFNEIQQVSYLVK